MVDIATSTWFPVVTLVAGYLMKAVSERLEHSRILQRERENRRETRRMQLAERRADFQRQTLLDLQEAIQDLARATGAAHHEDRMAFKKTQVWQRQPLGEKLNNDLLNASRRCMLLLVRINDDSIRILADSFRNNSLDVSNSPSEKDAQVRMMAAMGDLETLHKNIGERLRKLDDDEKTL
jgi:hypothetical protein